MYYTGCEFTVHVHVPLPVADPDDLLRFLGGSSAGTEKKTACTSTLFIFTSGSTTGRGIKFTADKSEIKIIKIMYNHLSVFILDIHVHVHVCIM